MLQLVKLMSNIDNLREFHIHIRVQIFFAISKSIWNPQIYIKDNQNFFDTLIHQYITKKKNYCLLYLIIIEHLLCL